MKERESIRERRRSWPRLNRCWKYVPRRKWGEWSASGGRPIVSIKDKEKNEWWVDDGRKMGICYTTNNMSLAQWLTQPGAWILPRLRWWQAECPFPLSNFFSTLELLHFWEWRLGLGSTSCEVFKIIETPNL